MSVSANDNVEGHTNARTIEPFHRVWTTHKTKLMNDQLYYVGEKYRKQYYDAGGSSLSQPPAYKEPIGKFDEYRQVCRALVDKCLPYHEAAKVLDALELREIVEAIVVHGRPVVGVGKVYSGYATVLQARSAAITALSIGLIALRNHYGGARVEIAA
jgi:hypothetical protein